MLNARDGQLDGLRAIAVMMVLYHHFFAEGGSFSGRLGVRLFFVLSGFLITRLLLGARSAAGFEPAVATKAFYVRRALRIFPPYFAALSLVWLTGLVSSHHILLWHGLYLANFWYAFHGSWSPWVLCHTWSLSIEEQFYVVWPFIILLAPRHLIERICVTAIALSLAYRLCWPLTEATSVAREVLPPASLDALAAGALLAAFRSRSTEWPGWVRISWLPLTIAFLLLLPFRQAHAPHVLEWMRWIALEILPLVPLVVIVGNCSSGLNGRLGRLLESSPLTATGRISYGIYLFHPLVLAMVVGAQQWIPLDVSHQGLSRFLVAAAGTLVVASVSWFALEMPLNSLKRYFPYVILKGASAATGGSPFQWPQATVSEVRSGLRPTGGH